MATVSDEYGVTECSAWCGVLAQDPKMLADLDSRGSGNLDSRTVTVCSALDFVNISYNNFVAGDEKTAKVHYRVFTRSSKRPVLARVF